MSSHHALSTRILWICVVVFVTDDLNERWSGVVFAHRWAVKLYLLATCIMRLRMDHGHVAVKVQVDEDKEPAHDIDSTASSLAQIQAYLRTPQERNHSATALATVPRMVKFKKKSSTQPATPRREIHFRTLHHCRQRISTPRRLVKDEIVLFWHRLFELGITLLFFHYLQALVLIALARRLIPTGRYDAEFGHSSSGLIHGVQHLKKTPID